MVLKNLLVTDPKRSELETAKDHKTYPLSAEMCKVMLDKKLQEAIPMRIAQNVKNDGKESCIRDDSESCAELEV
ncbi:hypothetical protein Tco_0624481 [Tanacetum coccineum]|uniref:Uncharacterized protein n=1 Tax=Tanacetum coccineum TaxID=301880 RepID=A0ABQ4WE75_9ASTR